MKEKESAKNGDGDRRWLVLRLLIDVARTLLAMVRAALWLLRCFFRNEFGPDGWIV